MFVIDDVLGLLGLDMLVYFRLICYLEKLKYFIMLRIKVFMICWEVVFRNEKILISVLFNKLNVILLNSEEYGFNI